MDNDKNKSNKIIKIDRYKEIFLYGVCGFLATSLNIGAYYVFSHLMHIATIEATIYAWGVAVLFAYISNRKYVFQSKVDNFHGIVRECFFFIGCRGWGELIDIFAMFIFVSCIHLPDMYVKAFTNLLVIVFNYVASKFYIFKQKGM